MKSCLERPDNLEILTATHLDASYARLAGSGSGPARLARAGFAPAAFCRHPAGHLSPALAAALTRYTDLPIGIALAVVCVTLVAILAVGAWLYAPRLAEQSEQITKTLPEAASKMTGWLSQQSWGAWVLEQSVARAQNQTLRSGRARPRAACSTPLSAS
jgi:hypothetical protein